MTVTRFAGYEITCDVCGGQSIIHTTDEHTFTQALTHDHRGPWSHINNQDVCNNCHDLTKPRPPH